MFSPDGTLISASADPSAGHFVSKINNIRTEIDNNVLNKAGLCFKQPTVKIGPLIPYSYHKFRTRQNLFRKRDKSVRKGDESLPSPQTLSTQLLLGGYRKRRLSVTDLGDETNFEGDFQHHHNSDNSLIVGEKG